MLLPKGGRDPRGQSDVGDQIKLPEKQGQYLSYRLPMPNRELWREASKTRVLTASAREPVLFAAAQSRTHLLNFGLFLRPLPALIPAAHLRFRTEPSAGRV